MPTASEGPSDPERGQRFDSQKVLLDPYAPSVFFPTGVQPRSLLEAWVKRTVARHWAALPRKTGGDRSNGHWPTILLP
jgi:hypothetical protein